jgi:hypothetical protein
VQDGMVTCRVGWALLIAARARAAREGRSLSVVLRDFLHAYAQGYDLWGERHLKGRESGRVNFSRFPEAVPRDDGW